MYQALCAGSNRFIARLSAVGDRTVILTHAGMPLRDGPAAIVTHLKDEGCEARRTHLANALAFGFALSHYSTACIAIITVNVTDAAEDVLASLCRFFDVVLVDSGTDRRRRCAGLLLGPALVQFQAVAIIESNALVLRNFDEIAWVGTPAIGVGPADDAVRGHFSWGQADHGIVVCRPSYTLFVRGFAMFNHLGGSGIEGDAWKALLIASTESEAFCIPTKYRFSPRRYDEMVSNATAVMDVALVIGHRSGNGAAHDEWVALHDRALGVLSSGSD